MGVGQGCSDQRGSGGRRDLGESGAPDVIGDPVSEDAAPLARRWGPVFPGAEWDRRSPEDMRLNAEAVARIGELMKDARANGALVHKGCLVAEWTFDGPSTQRFDVQSVTKSITSLVLGLALKEGRIPSLDAKVKAHYPGFDVGPYADEITFRHLITGTSGIKAGQNLEIYNATTWVKPGTESRYHNAHTLHLARALTYVFGEDLSFVLHDRVLSKIGASMTWDKMSPPARTADGRDVEVVRGFSGSRWTALDLARVGWLCANQGTWNGVQLLSPEYLAESMTPVPQAVKEFRTEAFYRAHDTSGLPYDPQRTRPGFAYGFSWWGSRMVVDGEEKWMWAMDGNYGQQCMVWPERGLVLVKVNTQRTPPYIRGIHLWPPLIGCLSKQGEPPNHRAQSQAEVANL